MAHVLEGHDILGVPVAAGAPVAATDDRPSAPAPAEASQLDGAPPDSVSISTYEGTETLPDHLADAVEAGAWSTPSAGDEGEHQTGIDPGGTELLEGPIVDHNLDGIDDTVQHHGHG
jgi:hypothetical protein